MDKAARIITDGKAQDGFKGGVRCRTNAGVWLKDTCSKLPMSRKKKKKTCLPPTHHIHCSKAGSNNWILACAYCHKMSLIQDSQKLGDDIWGYEQ